MAPEEILPQDVRLKIEESIRRILVSQLGVSAQHLAKNGSAAPLLGRGIGLDSMEALALVAAIEEEFDIQVADRELTVGLFKTITTLAEYVVCKTSAEKAS